MSTPAAAVSSGVGGDYVTMPPSYGYNDNDDVNEQQGSGGILPEEEEPAAVVMMNQHHRNTSSYLQMSEKEDYFGPSRTGSIILPPTISDDIAYQIRLDSEKMNQRWTILCVILACLSLISALIAMLIVVDNASLIACIAFAFPMITSPIVIGQRRKLNQIPSKLY